MNAAEATLVVVYFLVLGALVTLGFHRAVLLYLTLRHRGRVVAARIPAGRYKESQLPIVTIQLPLYNEATVVARLLDAVGQIDYPRDRLEIQVLDDSSDETRQIASAKVESLRAAGLDAHYVRRPNRHGYKAGALDYGMKVAKGEFIAIFDADFIPQKTFLRDIVHHFTDPQVAMVQTRWAHMNRDVNLLTRVQALMLDGHHLVENHARFASGCYFNFAGTGGMWRRHAIDDAGGWQHDTLTEDLDLSYRAQMKGWKFIYRPDILTPSELPEDMSALRAQQHRWAKGTVQTSRKLLPALMKHEGTSFHQRVEGAFHMLPHFAYPLMMALSVLMLPALALLPVADALTLLLIDFPLSVIATGSLVAFYAMAERSQGRSMWNAILLMPVLMGLGAGLAPHLTGAVWSGMRHMAGEFVRTPKKGEAAGRYRMAAKLPWAEMSLTLVCVASTAVALYRGHYFAAPFAALFAWGYGYVAALVIADQLPVRKAESQPAAEEDKSELAKAA